VQLCTRLLDRTNSCFVAAGAGRWSVTQWGGAGREAESMAMPAADGMVPDQVGCDPLSIACRDQHRTLLVWLCNLRLGVW
jgi:hypothetical protein